MLVCVLGVCAYSVAQFSQFMQQLELRPTVEALESMSVLPLEVQPVEINNKLPQATPNIVLIVADDLGWRDVGYHGSEIKTPTLDRLALSGVKLNRFYAQPSCSPTRAALLTGKSPMRLGVLAPLSKNNPRGLPLSETTLAERLKQYGYQTALIGKWHLGPRDLAYHPNSRGFDHFYGNLTGGVGYFDKVHGGGYDWQRNGATLRESGYTTQLLASEAQRVIRQRDKSKPMFLYFALGAPHLPNEAPERAITHYKHIKKSQRRIHAAMVSELDSAIDTLYQTLVEQQLDQNTLIWFMSDNGGLVAKNPLRFIPDSLFTRLVKSRFGDRASPQFVDFVRTNLRDGGADNRPFKEGKQSVFEGGVRVPSFIHWPEVELPREYNYMVTVQDVLPTLIEILGDSTADMDLDGQAAWRQISSDSPLPAKDYFVQVALPETVEAIYRYPYKLIVEPKAEPRLFDLDADPLETRNLAAREPELVLKLSEALQRFPRTDSVSLPMQQIIQDPDFFGGQEDRPPWADQAYTKRNIE